MIQEDITISTSHNIQRPYSTFYLYNSELWALTKKEAQKIDTFQRKFLRQITRSKRRIKTISMYKKCRTEHCTIHIQERSLKWFGHPAETPKRSTC